MRGGVVLTGGGANLINLSLLLQEISGYKVRIGFPRRQNFSAFGCPQIFETGASAAVGMLLEAKRDMRLNCAEDSETAVTETIAIHEPISAEDLKQGEIFPTDGGVLVPPDILWRTLLKHTK